MKKSSKIAIAALSGLVVVATLLLGISLWRDLNRVTDVAGDVSWYQEDGEEFTITTMEQLYGFAQLSESYDFKGQTIKLGADIVVNEGNAEDWKKKAPEHRWITITGFAGCFDGEGHTISGVYGVEASSVLVAASWKIFIAMQSLSVQEGMWADS